MTALSANDQADAKHREQVVAVWRDWRAYLQANLDLLAAQQHIEADVVFERQATDTRESRARGIIAAIPPDRRRLFSTVCAKRRAQLIADLDTARREAPTGVRTRGLDPDAVDERLYQTLRDEADGRTDDGLGRAPRDADSFYGIEVETLLAAPDAAAYGVQHGGLSRHGRLIGIIAIAIVGVGAMVFSLFASGRSATPRHSVAVARAGETILTPWTIDRVVVDVNGDTQTLPATMQATDGSWPTDGAGVEAGGRAPLTICLPAERLAQVSRVQVSGTGTVPDRTYHVTAAVPHPDLIVVACHGAGIPRMGMLTTTPLTAMGVGAPRSIGTQVVRLTQLTTEGIVTDPTLPADQVRVIATLLVTGEVDWVQLAPVLMLATGQTVQAGEIQAAHGTVTLRYLVPTFATPIDAILALTLPAPEAPLRWRGSLAPPETHAERLRQAVLVDAVAATQAATGIDITMTLRTTTSPVRINQADITLTTRDAQVVELQPFALDLTSATPSTVMVHTAAPASGTIWTLQLANVRYALALPEGR